MPKEQTKRLLKHFTAKKVKVGVKQYNGGVIEETQFMSLESAVYFANLMVDEKIKTLKDFCTYCTMTEGAFYKDYLKELKEVKEDLKKY